MSPLSAPGRGKTRPEAAVGWLPWSLATGPRHPSRSILWPRERPGGEEIKGTQDILSGFCLIASRNFLFTLIENIKVFYQRGQLCLYAPGSRVLHKPQLPASAMGKVQIANPGLQSLPDVCFALSHLRITCSAENKSRKS